MKEKAYYSVGEVSKICNISKKALRFYDKINIISPDKICDNNYRYYSNKTLLTVPVIKYYKQMGFKLEEMRDFVRGNTYHVLERTFREKLDELKIEEEEILIKHQSVKDWYDLIIEAEAVIECHANQVAIKYVDFEEYCFLKQPYNPDYMEAIINIDFTNHIEKINNKITGPIIIYFPSVRKKVEQQNQEMCIMQKTIIPCKKSETLKFGGCMMISCYHIGSYETIQETYEKILKWAESHGYRCGEDAYERYVTDYWTTRNTEQFVTEVLLKLYR